MRFVRSLSLAAVAALAVSRPVFALDPAEFDRQVDPCADLNAYVNGAWLRTDPIPPEEVTWGPFSVLARRSQEQQRVLLDELAAQAEGGAPDALAAKLGRLWREGLDEAAIERAGLTPIAPDLARIAAIGTREQLVAYLIDTYAQGMEPVFGLGSQPDFKDASRTIAAVEQGGLGLPTRDYYFDARFRPIRDAYVAYLIRLGEALGQSTLDATAHARAAFDLETRLAQASLSRVELRNPRNQYHWVTFAEAERMTPSLPWSRFFAAQGVRGERGFSLAQPKFFTALDTMIGDVPLDQWRAYLALRLVSTMGGALPDAFVQANFDFYSKTLAGQKIIKPRWQRALRAIDEPLGLAIGEYYVARYFPPESKQRAQALVDRLRAALKTRLEHLDWMSDATKRRALEKWAAFTPKIGYPDKWRDWRGLNISGRSYYADLVEARRYNQAYEMSKVGKPVDRTEWQMSPQTVNAYYAPDRNEIVFPAAILQPPFFDAKADDALNYGGIGAVIGHEMLHGYDDHGSQFDAHGNLADWWTPADRKGFEARADKLVKQFDAIEVQPGLHVNGKLTLGENIADLGGLQVAWDAFQLTHPADTKIDGETPAQRFFLNFGLIWREAYRPQILQLIVTSDPHAPSNLRANEVPKNLPEYARTFACKPGDAMVRADADRVKLW